MPRRREDAGEGVVRAFVEVGEAGDAAEPVLARPAPMRPQCSITTCQVWFDAERRLEASAANGVDAEVVSPFPPLPGRIYGLGTVPMQDPSLAAASLAEIRDAAMPREDPCGRTLRSMGFPSRSLTTSPGTTASGS